MWQGGILGVANTPSTLSASGIWRLNEQIASSVSFNWPLTNSIVALLRGEGSNNSTTIVDHSPLGIGWSAGGNAKISTAQFKYGSSSILFDGSGDYIYTTAGSSNFTFGTDDFTVEFWVWSGTLGGQNGFIAFDMRGPGDTSNKITIIYKSGSQLCLEVGGSNRITGGSLSLNTWHHVALCRASGISRLFINGTQTGSSYTDNFNYSCATNRPMMGGDPISFGGWWLNGYIDNVRITKAARYTDNFIPANY